MKTKRNHISASFLVIIFLLLTRATAFAQTTGRIVINEYMPWTLNGCGATSEFVELMNFGPGPIDISCYVLTDGDYSVTIPVGTILQPGQFYVIAGQNVIPTPCANIDSTITAQLNWNTCGCTSGPIPATGDGFFTDGGSGSEQIVLLDPNLQVVDAVVRDFPLEPSSPITTSAAGGCPSRTFDLDTMAINYERIGESTGRGNSFARVKDGDCGWVKDPQQSANATNNRSGDVSDITYDFTIVNSMECEGIDGSVDIYVKHLDYASVFPMTYTIVKDINGNHVFDLNDRYTHGTDSIPDNITFNGLDIGYYRITVASAKGCYLASFDFPILPCEPVLPVGIQFFRYTGTANGQHRFDWKLGELENLKSFVLEHSADGQHFTPAYSSNIGGAEKGTRYFRASVQSTGYTHYRLKTVSRDGKIAYSPVVFLGGKESSAFSFRPNPAHNRVYIDVAATRNATVPYRIFTAAGIPAAAGTITLVEGGNTVPVIVASLPPGVYYFVSGTNASLPQPISFRFVKQ